MGALSGSRFLEGSPFTILLALFVVFVASRVVKYRKNLRAVSYVPGMRVPFAPLTVGAFLPIRSWNPGNKFSWHWRKFVYKRYGTDTFSSAPWLFGAPAFYTANADVLRQVAGGATKSAIIKPMWASQALIRWGTNMFAAEGGEEWRRHRRIVGPAFNNELYETVWNETLDIYNQMVSGENWTDKDAIEVPVVQHLTTKIALLLIAKCGFGLSFNWLEPPNANVTKMGLQAAFETIAKNELLAIFMPKWASKLPIKLLRHINAAWDEIEDFMKGQVSIRRAEIQLNGGERLKNDIFSMLVSANENEGAKYQLDDNELIANVWLMLFAGHETTARTLAATLAFLAYHQDVQQEVLEQIHDVAPNDRSLVFDDYPNLNKVLAAFYEAVRLYPPAYILIREAAEDTTLQIPNPIGQEGYTTVPVLKGTTIVCDTVGLQYNPRYYDDPETYRPSRWYNITPESESFTPFGVGQRGCIGRKFATVEAVAFLASFLRDYHVLPLLKEGQSLEEWKDRITTGKVLLTLSVEDVPLKLVRRHI